MTSDVPGDLGADAPGLEQFLSTLTSAPSADELGGEQEALAMFRSSVRPPALAPAGTRPMRQWRSPARHRLRLAAFAATALVGAFAAAAYAAVLPPPLQRVAYEAFHAVGVPNAQHNRAGAGRGSKATSPPPSRHHTSPPAGRSHPAPSASPRHSSSASPRPSSSASPRPSASPTASPPAGAGTLSLQAASSQIPAGTPASLTGQLIAGGKAEASVSISLLERAPGQQGWQQAGQATTNKAGDVTFSVPNLGTNARFQLTDAGGDQSPVVLVKVVPTISAGQSQGANPLYDYLAVTTTYAERGDVVVLQVHRAAGWVVLRSRLLNASGETEFAVKLARMQGKEVRVVLLATRRHARAISIPVVVSTG